MSALISPPCSARAFFEGNLEPSRKVTKPTFINQSWKAQWIPVQSNGSQPSNNIQSGFDKPIKALRNVSAGSRDPGLDSTFRKVALAAIGSGLGCGATALYSGGGGNWIGNFGGGGGGDGGGWGGFGGHFRKAGVAMAVESDDDDDNDDDYEDDEDDDNGAEEMVGKKGQKGEEKKVPGKDAKKKEDGKKEGASDSKGSPNYEKHGLRPGLILAASKLSPQKRYKVSEINLLDQRSGLLAGMKDPFWDLLATLRKGGIFTGSQMEQELDALENSGMFESVRMEAVAKTDGTIKLNIKFKESEWAPARSVRIVNVGIVPPDNTPVNTKDPDAMEAQYERRLAQGRACMLPSRINDELDNYVSAQTSLTARGLQKIRDKIQKWYHDQGYVCAQVVNFGNLNTDEVVCEVVEGDITDVNYIFVDKLGENGEGATNLGVVEREMPEALERGMVFNMEAGRKALQQINALQLFANIEVMPRPDDEIEGGIVVDLKLKELEPKTAEVNTEWSIAPGDTGKPSIVNLLPGGSVSFELKNIKGLNRSLTGSVASGNLLNPQEELDFRLEYRHPYLDGVDDLDKNRVGNVSIFNNRKLAAVFVGGPATEEVPVVWVDRAGVKATVTEVFSRQSKLTYGAVLEEVTTRDENTAPCAQALKDLPTGERSPYGPPTTLSNTPTDRVGFLQANLTRDNTTFVNGQLVGARDILQVDQGVFVGSKFPFFNRHQLTMTRFIPLTDESEMKKGKQPVVGVLHGHYGGCVGDLPNYEAFSIGGPYSVRGYTMGEIGASSRVLELAGELRVPVKTTHAYVFGEFGSDLGGSKELKGNPTEYFKRKGYGASVGAGVKLGQVRAEVIRDCNVGAWSYFFRYGERF